MAGETGMSRTDLDRAWQFSQEQVRELIQRHPGYYPMYTVNGRWGAEGELWTRWCDGFLPGMMWLFALAGEGGWGEEAKRYTRPLEERKHDTTVHDLGFIFLSSYARWYELCREPSLMDDVAVAAMALRQRFQKAGGYIASFVGPHSLFIDIMMNVPILFVAAHWLRKRDALPQDPMVEKWGYETPGQAAEDLWHVGWQHCVTSQKYLVRQDGSTVHEAVFNPTTGQFVRESTHQGASAESCWSRGQAWALYGFARCFRLTGARELLDTAVRCADYFLNHLPEDNVPPWDFSLVGQADAQRDSSAAAIAASGLWTLADVLETWADTDAGESDRQERRDRAERYRTASAAITQALSSPHFLAVDEPEWEGILKHGVYHLPKGLGVDESVIWGDHYFVESLYKWRTGKDVPY